MSEKGKPLSDRLKTLVLGSGRNVRDRTIYHKLSLAAFLAWVGLGSDGLSSSCYGPSEAFVALGNYHYLGVFVALGTAITIFVISASYSQIVELFPSGGGGYLVASKLLSPRAGALSGCALLVDYVLTIALSVVSGADALFSFLPADPRWQQWRGAFAIVVVLALTLLNIRGVRESVVPLVPIFLFFVLTHVFIIGHAVVTHLPAVGQLPAATMAEIHRARLDPKLGLWGMIFLIMHSYSMGAGTYTGIEAVSNGVPVLREPRVHTAKRTMVYMATSLAVVAGGLMITYLLYPLDLGQLKDKTLNAIMMEQATGGWGRAGTIFVVVTLLSEGAILTIAAQTGFLDAPRVLANMALDRWVPTRLSMLSDRLTTANGVLLMSAAAITTIVLSGGSVAVLIVLYSINVFITFALSQLGMVRHWWTSRREVAHWRRKMGLNGVGLVLTLFILTWVVVAKFFEGGWVTLLVTSALLLGVSLIRRHYDLLTRQINEFNKLADAVLQSRSLSAGKASPEGVQCDPNAKTAVMLVSGFNGLGLHSLQNVVRYFGDCFKNFIFMGVGIVDAGNFKGASEVQNLEEHVRREVERYVELMRKENYYAEAAFSVGTDIADEVAGMSPGIVKRFPQAVFFAGQLIFSEETFFTRWLHNNIVFTVQKRLYKQGVPFVILPFRV